MSGNRFFSNCIIAGTFATAALVLTIPAVAQVATQTAAAGAVVGPHTIIVKLIERPGAMPFAFEPATFTAQHGDTLRFVQAASAMHNVRFKTQPKGAKLGGAASSPYLTGMGQSYSLVIDARFADGTYEIVCDPHEMIGMHAFLTVGGTTHAASGGKP
jgi:plastocyanin